MTRPLALSLTAALLLAHGLPAAAQPATAGPQEQLAPETNPAVPAPPWNCREPNRSITSVPCSPWSTRPPRARRPHFEGTGRASTSTTSSVRHWSTNSVRTACCKLARTAALAPAAQQFAESCMAAAASRGPRSAADRQADRRGPGSVRARPQRGPFRPGRNRRARRQSPLLEALARETDSEHRAAHGRGGRRHGPLAVDPLLGMLSTNDPALRRDVIRILKAMQVTLAKPFIAAAPRSADAERLLGRSDRPQQSAACELSPPTKTTPSRSGSGMMRRKSSASPVTRSKRHRSIWAARLALEYARLRPNDRLAQCQALVLGLEADCLAGGPRSPAVEETALTNADGDMLNRVLNAAMKNDFPLAAATCRENAWPTR